jgi:hypothetical protein
MVQPPDIARLLSRIEAEYRELPGLRLTRRQMQRLWDLDQATCAAVIEVLVRRRILVKTEDEIFIHPRAVPSSYFSRRRKGDVEPSTGSRRLVGQDGIEF